MMINDGNICILVMGVSGSGKTTLARALSQHLKLKMIEADDYHPEGNVSKMKLGIPLNDDDRLPWLSALNKAILKNKGCVLACSALKKKYRNILKAGVSHFITVYLNGDFNTIHHRMKSRGGHFMPTTLLQSQFDTLEPPVNSIIIDIESSTQDQIRVVKQHLIKIEENQMKKADIGLIGLGVMGKALARNLASKNHKVAVYNVPFPGEERAVQEFTQSYSELDFIGCEDLEELAGNLVRPRKIILMIKAGYPVDEMTDKLLPILQDDDMIIDAGNSFYKDTEFRTARCKVKGIHFIGMGVSGGESGALNGPSIMPSGDPGSKDELLPILQKIAATADGYPCVRWIGKGGAGHFVKMIHNGIEYADMQLISEVYFIMKHLQGKSNEDIASTLTQWKDSLHNSYLLDISINILRKHINGNYILDEILDVAGHKGTGLWTSREALELGVPVPTIQAAMNQRILSSFKGTREKIGWKSIGSQVEISDEELKEGLLFCRFVSIFEGIHMITTANIKYDWGISLKDVLSVWRGGCIIRSDMLLPLKEIFSDTATIGHPLENKRVFSLLSKYYPLAYKMNMKLAQSHLSIPCIHAAIDHYRSITTSYLPINMIQAQRDYFGAHTYKRLDNREQSFHTHWE
ncbi:MAG: NADP-dependent phosphogluconate dehydrogenase [Saprospiraceae bacterium]|nr:NADP-dependent phosphogluconate dehydrogenase [Saprospiraceae bacterium]